jgi:dipeptidyl aminopeptidase/acylaminoacyl peptidase
VDDSTEAAWLALSEPLSPSFSVTRSSPTEPEKISSSRFDGTLGIAWLGSRIVFTTMVRRERQIWVMDADGSNRRALTNEGDSAWPRLSHDGSFIAFFGSRDGHPGIWRMDPDGGNVGKLADVADASYLDITPDDRWITFTSIIDATSSTWRVSTDGGAPERLIQFFERATISHDGMRMFGVHPPAGGAIGLAVLPVTGGNPLWLKTPEAMASGGGIMQWNHADDGILYTTAERSNLNLYRLADGTSTRVTRFVEDALLRGALSPDGRSLLVTRVAASQEPYLITNFR